MRPECLSVVFGELLGGLENMLYNIFFYFLLWYFFRNFVIHKKKEICVQIYYPQFHIMKSRGVLSVQILEWLMLNISDVRVPSVFVWFGVSVCVCGGCSFCPVIVCVLRVVLGFSLVGSLLWRANFLKNFSGLRPD